LIDIKNIDFCELLKSGSVLSVIKNQINEAQKYYSFLPFNCPVKIGKYYGNSTLIDLPDPKVMTRQEILAFQKVNSSKNLENLFKFVFT
jgi:hypothetical protein